MSFWQATNSLSGNPLPSYHCNLLPDRQIVIFSLNQHIWHATCNIYCQAASDFQNNPPFFMARWATIEERPGASHPALIFLKNFSKQAGKLLEKKGTRGHGRMRHPALIFFKNFTSQTGKLLKKKAHRVMGGCAIRPRFLKQEAGCAVYPVAQRERAMERAVVNLRMSLLLLRIRAQSTSAIRETIAYPIRGSRRHSSRKSRLCSS